MSASTYSIQVAGPSPALAYLHALFLKLAAAGSIAWSQLRGAASLVLRTGRAAAETALAILASDAGYRAATTAVRNLSSAVWRGVSTVVTGIGRGLSWLGRLAKRAVAIVSPRAADWLQGAAKRVAQPVRAAWRWTDTTVRAAGEVAWYLMHTPLVRRATRMAAQAASLLLMVHAASKGAVAAKIVAMVPASMDLVIALTNPVLAIAFVAAVAGAAMGAAFIRLLTQPDQEPHGGPDQDDPSEEPEDLESESADEEAVLPLRVAEVLVDLEAVAARVQVEVKGDGSVHVHGIPADVPPDLGHVVAEIARNAVEAHLRRVLMLRRKPSRDDRRLFTKAAREAILAEARRRQREGGEQAA